MTAIATDIDLTNISPAALTVLAALAESQDTDSGGSFGFMGTALDILRNQDAGSRMSRHAFAGYVSALSGFIGYSEDLSGASEMDCYGVQFVLTEATWNAREQIANAAAGRS